MDKDLLNENIKTDIKTSTKKRKKNPSKKRCNVKNCNKKLSIAELQIGLCKCNKVYCSKHRIFSNHDCDYNYKQENEKKLKEENPEIKFDKFNKF
jgi:hypothetical protein